MKRLWGKKVKNTFVIWGYMQVVNVATFWSYNKTVESPFEVEPQSWKGSDLLGTKKIMFQPPPPHPVIAKSCTRLCSYLRFHIVHLHLLNDHSCGFQDPHSHSQRYLFRHRSRRRHPKWWFLCLDQRKQTGKHLLQHPVQGTHRLRWHQSSPTRHRRQFPILHCRGPQPYLLLAWDHRQDEHLKRNSTAPFMKSVLVRQLNYFTQKYFLLFII